MPLELELETLDGVDENLKSFYEEKDGVFRLAVNGLDDAVAGKSTLIKEREARRIANEKLAKIEQEREQERKEAVEKEKQFLEKEGKFEDLLKLEREERAKERLAKEELAKGVEKRELEKDALALAASESYDNTTLKTLTKEFQNYARWDGEKVVYEVNGLEVERAALIEHVRNENPRLVKSSGMSGGGATGNNKTHGVQPSDAKRQQAISDAKKSGNISELRKAHNLS